MQAPVIVVNTKTQRESGRKAQYSNIMAAKVKSANRLMLLPLNHFSERLAIFSCFLDSGRCHTLLPGPLFHAKDAHGSHGRHCLDK